MWLWQALRAVDVACARMGVACIRKGTARSVDTSSTGMGVTCTRASAGQAPFYSRHGTVSRAVDLPGLTFQILASLPYTTAMLLALLSLMSCFSVSLSSSDTKPMKELSGV